MDTSKRRRSKTSGAERPDMTPMIDVTFLLLIFFLCLEFKTLEGKLASNLPKDRGSASAHTEPVEDVRLRIAVRAAGRELPDVRDPRRFELVGHACEYWLGRKRLRDLASLEPALRAAARVQVPGGTGVLRTRPLSVESGPGTRYGDVTAALDLARESGFEEITFAAR